MLGHVAERLLCDSVERDVDVRVETNRIERGGDVERAPALEGVEQMGDELGEVDVCQAYRAVAREAVSASPPARHD